MRNVHYGRVLLMSMHGRLAALHCQQYTDCTLTCSASAPLNTSERLPLQVTPGAIDTTSAAVPTAASSTSSTPPPPAAADRPVVMAQLQVSPVLEGSPDDSQVAGADGALRLAPRVGVACALRRC